MSDSDDAWYWNAGNIIGTIASIVTFIAIYIAACGKAGWVIGIALGWIPALIGGVLCYMLVKLLWLPALLIVGALLLR